MNIAEAVATRRSVREFLDTPVPYATIERVLDQARFAPSGCNYQPWEATVLTGAPLKALQDVLLAAQPDDPQEYDWAAPGKHPQYQARLQAVGAAMYGAMQVARADKEARSDFTKANLVSFGAPVLLLLDEATSHIDSETEQVVQTALTELRGKVTIIAIAHRLSTIRDADQIIVLNHGRLVEQGRHAELMDVEQGIYQKLYLLQALEE